MNTIIKSGVLVGLCLLFNSEIFAQEKSTESAIPKMLITFYSTYIKAFSEMEPNKSETVCDSIRNLYCSKNLLAEIKIHELDYDPFLNAQDADIEWLKTLKITKDPKRNWLYTVSYLDNYSKETVYIKLKIVKLKESFKIDAILRN